MSEIYLEPLAAKLYQELGFRLVAEQQTEQGREHYRTLDF